MRTSVGILDALFGKRITFEVPGLLGKVKRVSVTEKWMKKMIAEKRIKDVTEGTVVVVMDGPQGERTATARVGVDIDQATVDEFLDPETVTVYGMYCFKNDEEVQFFVQRSVYEKTKRHLSSPEYKASIDSEVDRAMGWNQD